MRIRNCFKILITLIPYGSFQDGTGGGVQLGQRRVGGLVRVHGGVLDLGRVQHHARGGGPAAHVVSECDRNGYSQPRR